LNLKIANMLLKCVAIYGKKWKLFIARYQVSTLSKCNRCFFRLGHFKNWNLRTLLHVFKKYLQFGPIEAKNWRYLRYLNHDFGTDFGLLWISKPLAARNILHFLFDFETDFETVFDTVFETGLLGWSILKPILKAVLKPCLKPFSYDIFGAVCTPWYKIKTNRKLLIFGLNRAGVHYLFMFGVHFCLYPGTVVHCTRRSVHGLASSWWNMSLESISVRVASE
jgi:hypothetical protein